ncbi:MAG: hypothetical protein KBC12_00865 [Candidatus Pacebacteria bacterium]|nr:hypothetical protein [Candidatus Paceibacterota bacterium]
MIKEYPAGNTDNGFLQGKIEELNELRGKTDSASVQRRDEILSIPGVEDLRIKERAKENEEFVESTRPKNQL